MVSTAGSIERQRALEQLITDIQANGGILRVTMGRLRDVCGWDKLGKYVVQDISDQLKKVGIGHLPREADQLPRYQHLDVRVFLTDSLVGRLILSVQQPSESGDELLRQVGDNDAVMVIEKIRALVCHHGDN
ncbi:MAG: hypothetical protein M1401_04290 [Chloroflexi bacterium]|nr:hypothetical protein [Chloroflexota bacterium]MCL5108077.1 hypothetical protein [Chloroflexota bacterium]MDA8219889.1 hypothetical protein [Dehalococcoidales bacterium]